MSTQCVLVNSPITNCCGMSYSPGDVVSINSDLARFFARQNIVSPAVEIASISCAGVVCGRVANPDWRVMVEVDLGATGEVDYVATLTPNPDGSFGTDLRAVPADPPAEGGDAGEPLPLEQPGDRRIITVSVDVGGQCGTIAEQLDCTVSDGMADPCASLGMVGGCA